MPYSFQTVSSGQTLTAVIVNQTEVNVRDHLHGVDSVTKLYGGIWTSTITEVSSTPAHKFNTQSTWVNSGTRLFSICNSGTEKFGINADGSCNVSKVKMTASVAQNIANITWTIASLNTSEYDLLSEFNVTSAKFTATNTGYYGFSFCTNFPYAGYQYSGQAQMYKNNSALDFPAQITVSRSFHTTIQLFNLISLNANDYVDIRVYHNSGVSQSIFNSGLSISRVL